MNITQYRGIRRLVQLSTLLMIALVPAFGLFRIDLSNASFTILDNQIWWSNFFFVFGLSLVLITIPIIIYMTLGTAWCGWGCPQNLLTEWANNLTFKLLGKRASVDVNGGGMQVAADKNRFINWSILALAFLVASLFLSLVPFLFFFSFTEVRSFIAGDGGQLSVFMQRLYFFTVFLIFIDIAAVRYFMCDYACLYRIGQKMFKSRDALHVVYDASRADMCSKCNYCAASCVTKIEPTHIKMFDTCTNCGECIDACNRLQAKSEKSGLLSFEFGDGTTESTWIEKSRMLLSRINLPVGVFFVMGLAMMLWGIHTQPQALVQIPIEVQLKERQVTQVCDSRCKTPQTSCKNGDLSQCYVAAACKCSCRLQQDPDNISREQWQRCVQQNTSRAETLQSPIASEKMPK